MCYATHGVGWILKANCFCYSKVKETFITVKRAQSVSKATEKVNESEPQWNRYQCQLCKQKTEPKE